MLKYVGFHMVISMTKAKPLAAGLTQSPRTKPRTRLSGVRSRRRGQATEASQRARPASDPLSGRQPGLRWRRRTAGRAP